MRSRSALVLLCLAAVLAGCGDEPATSGQDGPRWSRLDRSTVARTEVAAAVVGRSLYVAGSFAAPDGLTTDVVERYDLVRGAWSRVAPLPQALNHAAAASDGRSLYVVGGYAGRRSLDEEVA